MTQTTRHPLHELDKARLLADLERLTSPNEDHVLRMSASYGDMGLWVYQNLDALKEALRDD